MGADSPRMEGELRAPSAADPHGLRAAKSRRRSIVPRPPLPRMRELIPNREGASERNKDVKLHPSCSLVLSRNLLRLAGGICLVLLCAACASDRGGTVSSSNERIYNPQTGNYEWRTPDRAPTSPGADRTSRQSYR